MKKHCALALCILLALSKAAAMADKPGGSVRTTRTVTLRGYAHIKINSGAESTEVLVAGVGGNLSRNTFGSVMVVDDPLLLTADGDADADAVVGRIKGTAANTDITRASNNTSLYLTFLVDWKGASGTVAVSGTSVKSQTVREVGIVGGTGAFQLARGIATQQTVAQSVGTDGSVTMVNEWRLIFHQDPLGPDIGVLHRLFSDLVAADDVDS